MFLTSTLTRMEAYGLQPRAASPAIAGRHRRLGALKANRHLSTSRPQTAFQRIRCGPSTVRQTVDCGAGHGVVG